ncbi:MAG TPA: hypothetical protein VKZ53_00570 [Candidatus Angelobacter sp.]|nr:hypothetical protein [Candidatus Angelobacter sp.]
MLLIRLYSRKYGSEVVEICAERRLHRSLSALSFLGAFVVMMWCLFAASFCTVSWSVHLVAQPEA